MPTLVSVVMPLYNSIETVESSINSVLSQTHQSLEIIVVDDCSTDGCFELVSKLAKRDSRVKVFRLDKNSGAGVARNKAIDEASGQYISFLDSDDLWKTNKLEVQLNFMKQEDISFCCSWYDVLDADNNLISVRTTPPVITYRRLLMENCIGCLTVIYDQSLLGKRYMPEIRKRQDYALWLDLINSGATCKSIQTSLACYRVFSGSISRNKFEMLVYNYKMFRESQKFGVVSSLFFVGLNISFKIFRSLCKGQLEKPGIEKTV